jgi:glycosyltransferase involved in cell wall biosynthesis
MARIVLDGIHAHVAGTGLARYAREVLARLLRRLDDHELIVIATPRTVLPNSPATIPVPGAVSPEHGGRSHVARALWRELVLPGTLRRYAADLYFTPVPELPRRTCPAIATVHDLIPLEYPRLHWKQVWLFAWNLGRTLNRADRLVTISAQTRDRLAARWRGKATPRFHVVPNGTSAPANPAAPDPSASDDDAPYVLFVGDARPYKGLATAIRALSSTRSGVRLRVAGRVRPAWLRRLEADCGRDALSLVERLDYVSEARLEQLYRGARAVVCPSESEGFGLVPLEAMRRGTPAIVSDIPVFREILDGWAHFAPVGEPAAWATAMDDVVLAENHRSPAELTVFAKRFDWDCTAAGIEAIIREQLGEGPGTSTRSTRLSPLTQKLQAPFPD